MYNTCYTENSNNILIYKVIPNFYFLDIRKNINGSYS